MSDTIQFKRKSVLHWDTVTFDGLFLTLRELQRAIAQKRFPELLDRAEEAIEVYEGDVKLTDPLKQIPRGSRVPIKIGRVEERKQDFQRRTAGPASLPAVGDGRDTAAAAAGAAIFEDDAELIEHRMAATSAPAPPAVRGRGRGFRGGNFSRGPPRCRICGLEGHDAGDCPHKDAERKVRVTGIPAANLVPDEKGTLLLNGTIPARIQTDEQAFQHYVGNRTQPASLPAPTSDPASAPALNAPQLEAPLAITQFPHSEAPSAPQGPAPPALPQLAGSDMVFEDAFLEEPLPAAAPRSPLPARSPQQDAPSEAQLVRLASLQLRADEAELDRLQRKQAHMNEPLTMVEFETLKRLPNKIELGRQKRDELRSHIEQQPRPQLSPARARHTRDAVSRSRSRSRTRRRRSPSRERSPVRRHRSDHSRCAFTSMLVCLHACQPLTIGRCSGGLLLG